MEENRATLPLRASGEAKLRLPAVLLGASLAALVLSLGLLGWLSQGGEMLLALASSGLSVCF